MTAATSSESRMAPNGIDDVVAVPASPLSAQHETHGKGKKHFHRSHLLSKTRPRGSVFEFGLDVQVDSDVGVNPQHQHRR